MGPRAKLKKALERVAELKAVEGDYSDAQIREITALDAEVKSLRKEIADNDSAAAALKSVLLDDDAGDLGGRGRGVLNLKSATMADTLANGLLRETVGGKKALAPAGESIAPIAIQASPVAQGRPAAGLLDLIPVIANSPARFEWLKQTSRAMNAGPVAEGAVKPTSGMGLSREAGELRTVAHLTDPISIWLLSDFEAIEAFIQTELVWGLIQALERQVLAGTGVAPQLDGILSTSGVLEEAFTVDALTTARRAITRLEASGLEPSGFVFSPADYQELELSRTSGSGVLEMVDSPIDRAARRLWGVPVAVSAALEDGKGVLLSRDSVQLRCDAGISVRYSENVSNDFETNSVRARCEVRAATQVSRPGGIVVVSTASA